MNIEQELFLNDTLVMAGFDPKVDNFEMLKEDMRLILDEYIELNLYKFLSEEEQSEYDKLRNKSLEINLEYFKKKISDFDNILAHLYMDWQEKYLENFKD